MTAFGHSVILPPHRVRDYVYWEYRSTGVQQRVGRNPFKVQRQTYRQSAPFSRKPNNFLLISTSAGH